MAGPLTRGILGVALAASACAAPSGDKTPDGRMDGAYTGTPTLDPTCGT